MKYRQITHRLRLQMGPGKPDIESERPRNKKTGRYTDLDAAGQSTTLVDVPDGATPSAEYLLRLGRIETLPAAPRGKPAKGGPPDGETAG